MPWLTLVIEKEYMSILKIVVALVSAAVFGVCCASSGEIATKKALYKKEVAVIEHKVDLATAANVLSDVEAGEEVAPANSASAGEVFFDSSTPEEDTFVQKVAYKEKSKNIEELDEEVGLPVAPYGETTTEVAQEDFDKFNFDEFARMLEKDFDLLGDESEE